MATYTNAHTEDLDETLAENCASPNPFIARQPVSQFVEAIHNLKLPNFWRQRPQLWFAHIESQFVVNRISSDNNKFHAVVAALDATVMEEVADIVEKPPEVKKYDEIKRKLIIRFSDSPENLLSRALSELELGDLKPSSLWRQMRSMVDGQLSDDTLKTFWLKKLPSRAREILMVATNIDVDALTEMADKIMRVNDSHVAAISSSESNENRFEQELAVINKKFEQLTAELRNNRQRQRSRSRSTGRRRTTSTSLPSSPGANDICYYHRRFGNCARNCRAPCTFRQPEN